jgi:serine/threonine protein kinase
VLNTILRGHYKIVKHLGGGGFGQTYLAEDIDLPKHSICVVKQLKPTSKEPFVLETSKRLFDQEAEVLYTLGSHDRIPRLLAHFQEGDEFYLVQEFADGKDLTHEIGKGIRFPESFVIDLIKEVLEILVFVHERGVVHRDIKPANLIRRKSDRKIILIDFGAVKEIGSLAVDSQGNTNLTIAIGSPGYMPTEQINGKPRFSSDIYAVGMMAIQAITGAEPRRFAEHPETAELIWRDRLPQDGYSSKFLDILDKMVRYDFRQRYQTAQEVLKAIASLPNDSHDLQTVLTNSTRTQAITVNEEQPNKRKLPWTKIAIGAGCAVLASTIAAIAIFNKSPATNQETNNSVQPTSKPNVVLSPSPTISPTPTPTKSVEDDYVETSKFYYRNSKYSEALTSIDQALKLAPNSANAWDWKGRILEKMSRYKDAYESYSKAVEIKPDSQIAKKRMDDLARVLKFSKPNK